MQPLNIQHLTLRPIVETDLGVMEGLLKDPDIHREFSNLAKLDSKGLEKEIEGRAKGFVTNPWLMLVNNRTNEVEGFFIVRHYKTHPGCQIYYALRPEGRGKGFATETLIALSRYLYWTERVPILFLRGDRVNHASLAVADRSGYRVFSHKAFEDTFFGYMAPGLEPEAFMEIFGNYFVKESSWGVYRTAEA